MGGGERQHVGGSKQRVKARSTYLPARVYRVYVGEDKDTNLMNSPPDSPKTQQNVKGHVLPMAIQFNVKNGVRNDGRDMFPAHEIPPRPFLTPPPPPRRPPHFYFSLASPPLPQQPQPPLLTRSTLHQDWILEASKRSEARKKIRARNHESFLKLYAGGTLSPQEKTLYSYNVPPMPQEPPPPGSYHWKAVQKQNKETPPHYYNVQNRDPLVKEPTANLQYVLDSNDDHFLNNEHERHIKNEEMKAKASQTFMVWPGNELVSLSQSINAQQNGGRQDWNPSKQIPLIPPRPTDVRLGGKVSLIAGDYSDRHHKTFPLNLAPKEQKKQGIRWIDESLIRDQNKIDLVTQNIFQSQRLESKTNLATMDTSPHYERVLDTLQHVDIQSKPGDSANSPTKTAVFNFFKSLSSPFDGFEHKDRGPADTKFRATNTMQNIPMADVLQSHLELEVPNALKRDTLKANRTNEVLYKNKYLLFKKNMLKNAKIMKRMKDSKYQLDLPQNVNKEFP